jgi:hypothetical protein
MQQYNVIKKQKIRILSIEMKINRKTFIQQLQKMDDLQHLVVQEA